jgi:hypothetical protein
MESPHFTPDLVFSTVDNTPSSLAEQMESEMEILEYNGRPVYI